MSLAHIISVSGGKDSTALYLKALERGRPFTAVFADTGNEHEWTYDYVRELPRLTGGPEIQWVKQDLAPSFASKRKWIAEKWPAQGIPQSVVERALKLLQPSGNPFLDLCMVKGRFPSARARFCTQFLKVKPIADQVYRPLADAGRPIVSWQGVRAEESHARSLLPPWQRLNLEEVPHARLYAYRPLLTWTLGDVWAMHDRHGIPRNRLYDHGMGRVGCMPCIMAKKGELREIGLRFPEHIERIAEWEAIVSEVSKRGFTTFFSITDDPSVSKDERNFHHSTHGIHSRVEWSKTSRGGRQYDLTSLIDFNTTCDQWGACE